MKSIENVVVIIPNWNGDKSLKKCLDSLLVQNYKVDILVVDNGSIDKSLEIIENYGNQLIVIKLSANIGFAGGVNKGIEYAINNNYQYFILLNNDAYVDQNWSFHLVKAIKQNMKYGIVTSKILNYTGKKLDSSGDFYTIWGLPYPRGRGSIDIDYYDNNTTIFSASGGSSIYKVEMINKIGLFDEDFFAYYEDVDLSFRAQLNGWEIIYEPQAITYHMIGATSSKISGFTTYQTMKNLPLLIVKNIPLRLLVKILPRFIIVYSSFLLSSLLKRQLKFSLKGFFMFIYLFPRAYKARRYNLNVLKNISSKTLSSKIIYDLPPNAKKLKKIQRLLMIN